MKKKYYVTLMITKEFDGSVTLKQIEEEMKKVGWMIDTVLDFGEVNDKRKNRRMDKQKS